MTQPPPPQQQPAWAQQPPPPGQQAAWSQAPAPSPARRANPFAIVALVLAAMLLLLTPAQQLSFNLTIGQQDGGAAFGTISTIFGVGRLVLTLAVVGLGAVGLVVRDRGRLLAAAAVGIGVYSLVAIVLSFTIGLALSGL